MSRILQYFTLELKNLIGTTKRYRTLTYNDRVARCTDQMRLQCGHVSANFQALLAVVLRNGYCVCLFSSFLNSCLMKLWLA